MGAASNLSLGKLKRAVDGTNSYTTADTSLGAQNDGSSETKMSDFTCGTIGSLTISDDGPGTSASGTATLAFSSQGSLFNTKIRNRNDNFTWSEVDPASALSITSGDYNTAYTVTPAAPINATLTVRVIFKEDGQTDGFNSEATNYNTVRSDTYTYTGGS